MSTCTCLDSCFFFKPKKHKLKITITEMEVFRGLGGYVMSRLLPVEEEEDM